MGKEHLGFQVEGMETQREKELGEGRLRGKEVR